MMASGETCVKCLTRSLSEDVGASMRARTMRVSRSPRAASLVIFNIDGVTAGSRTARQERVKERVGGDCWCDGGYINRHWKRHT